MVVAGVSVFAFLYKLLCTAAWVVLRLARRLIEVAGRAIAVKLFESLFLLSLPIYLFPQPYKHLVEITEPKSLLLPLSLLIRFLLQLRRHLMEITELKGSLLSNAYVALLFDRALFAVIV